MTELIRYEAARQALAECRSIDEVKDIHDKSVAVAAYARQAKDRTLLCDAIEIRVRAQRRLGELIGDLKARGTLAQGRPSAGRTTVKLPDLGISRTESHNAQRIAGIPAPQFERDLVHLRRQTTEGRPRARLSVKPVTLAGGLNLAEIPFGSLHKLIELLQAVEAEAVPPSATMKVGEYIGRDRLEELVREVYR